MCILSFLLVLVFSIFHHAHILDKNSTHAFLSKCAMVLGCVAAVGAFVAGNCNVCTNNVVYVCMFIDF